MKTHPVWTIATLCWFFVLFNIERLIPAINLASFVYVLSTIAGLVMLGSRRIRKLPFGVTAAGFVIFWVVGKAILGYSLDIYSLPLSMTEVFSLVISQYLCLQVAQNTDTFAITSRQLLEVLQACSVPDVRDAESLILEEIRRARRHERPLTFVALNPGSATPESIRDLLRQMEASLSREYMTGCISEILERHTKSHDIAVRVDNQFLMLLPETNADQAAAMSIRLQKHVSQELGLNVTTEAFAFGLDELTLTGVLDRIGAAPLDATAPQSPEVYELKHSRPEQLDDQQLVGSAS